MNIENEILFSHVIESIYERHSSTLITMAKGIVASNSRIKCKSSYVRAGAHELRTLLNDDIYSFSDRK